MNAREKLLAGCLVGVFMLAGLWMIVRWGVVARWQGLNERIAQTAKKERDLRRRLEEAREAKSRWAAITPVSHNPEIGAQRFREDLSQLLDRHGLGADCTLQKLPPRKLKISGFTEVRFSITTRGSLRQVLDFLCDFYRRQYPAKLEVINLTAEEQGRRANMAARNRARPAGRRAEPATPASPSDADGPRLNVSITATALVLPELSLGGAKIPQDPRDPLEPPAGSLGQLPRERAEYNLVLERNLFKPWQPPIVEAPPPLPPPGGGDNPKVNTPIAEVPKAEPRPEKTLIGVASTDRELAAWVREEARRDLAPERVQVNDTVDDGRLVLVVPRGMVVQVPSPSGSGLDYRYYLYKLGNRFSERELLDPERYPDIQRELEQSLTPR